MNHYLLLSGVGLMAGAMNALAGGGSFVALPALIAVGLPSVQANASSTVALFPGGIASAFGYREGLGPVAAVPLRALILVSVLGGMIGSVLLLHTPSITFNFVLPWLLLLATVALAFGRRLGESMRQHWSINTKTILAIQLCLGIYGGYFGGAVGIMMMASWRLLDRRDLKALNAPRTILVSATNTVAVLVFILAHAIRWPETLVMLVAATVGGYGGARIGRRATSRIIHAGTILVTASITAAFFVRAYL